jgi:hypothetical protein
VEQRVLRHVAHVNAVDQHRPEVAS